MRITNYETKNPFAAFALRGGRLRKRGRGVVSYAPFLTGMVSAVVLGSLALSTPSLAQDTNAEGNNKTEIYTNVTTVFTDKAKGSSSSGNPTSVNPDDSPYIRNTPSVFDTTVTTSGSVSVVDTGVYVYRSGRGVMELNNSADIDDAYYGIEASHTGNDDLIITNSGRLTNIEYDGIFATRAGEGAISISSTSAGEIDVGNWGIHAGHIGTGGIAINNSSRVTSEDTGIHARHRGTEGNISVTSSSRIDADEVGIYAGHRGEGDISVTSSSRIDADDVGIYAGHRGEGDISVTNSSEIVNNSSELGAFQAGIHARHRGTEGNISVTNSSKTGTFQLSIYARHEGEGDISVTNSSEIVANSSTPDAFQFSIYAGHEGEGDISVTHSSRITSEGYGITMRHSGMGNIEITNKGSVGGGNKGILVNHLGTGDIVFKIDDGSSVSANRDYGIATWHSRTGNIKIDVSGRISGGTDNGPVYMSSGGTKTLVLRPGFELNSGQSGVNHASVISVGAGEGVLELNQDDDGTSASATLDFEALEFRGFKRFEKKGENTWRIYGTASESNETFSRAVIEEGVLRFMGGVTFRADGSTGSTRRSGRRSNRRTLPDFRIDDDAVLDVVGVNTLDANLRNEGTIVFTYDPNVDEDNRPASVLNLGTNSDGKDYEGGGKLIFYTGPGGFRSDKLKIRGDNKNTTEITYVEILGGIPSGFNSRNHAELPMEIEVFGTATQGSFATEETGGYDINHHKYVLGPDTSVGGTTHKWKFQRGAELSTTSSTTTAYAEGVSGLAESTETSSGSGDSGGGSSGLGFRADIRGHAGGIWGRQKSLRTSEGPSAIASKGLRTEDNRVYFGYDMPTMNFMGGDIVVGTNVWHGFSVSDVFSSSGRSSIDVESHAAALSASWWSPGGFYADGRTQYVRFSGDILTERSIIVRDNQGVGMSVSMEAGYRFAVPLGGMDFGIVPQAQLVWSRADFEDFAGLNGEVVSLEDGELVTGRLGLSWDGEWQDAGGSGRIYGGVNLYGAVDGETTISISGVPLSRERSDLSADGRLGVSYEWDEGYEVHGEATALRRDDAEEFRADFGMSIDF